MKIKCVNNCNRIAEWLLMSAEDVCYCDECVPRGCSCNIQYDIDGIDEELTDEYGRYLPCIEYDYYPYGIDELEDKDYEDYEFDS